MSIELLCEKCVEFLLLSSNLTDLLSPNLATNITKLKRKRHNLENTNYYRHTVRTTKHQMK